MTSRTWLIVGFTVLALAAALLVPAMPQPVANHDFADHRDVFGIHNFLDVASNGAFLIVGVYGLVVALGRRARFEFAIERWPYVIFFVGVTLTAAGSPYQHLAPDNETLFWDRLPMTFAFMALVCSHVVDRMSVRAGLAPLIPMFARGIASVIYGRVTQPVAAVAAHAAPPSPGDRRVRGGERDMSRAHPQGQEVMPTSRGHPCAYA